LLVLAGLARAAEVVETIDIVGLEDHDGELIERAFGLSEGDTIATTELRAAIARVHALGLFDDVWVMGWRSGERLMLELQVVESPRIAKLVVDGVDRLSDAEVEEALRLVEGQVLDRREVFDSARRVRDLLVEQGHLNAAVEIDIGERSERGVEVDLEADAGEKVRIGRVYVAGNTAFDDEDLKGLLENKERRWYRGGDFKESELESDAEKIENRYRGAGFRDVEVYDHRLSYKKSGAEMVLEFFVDEGRRYFVGDVTWDGNEVLGEERLEAMLELRPGSEFDQGAFDQTRDAIGRFYADRGYIYSLVQPGESVRGDSVDVHFTIREGEPAHIRRVEVAGNVKTKDHVIRRELHIFPGDVYSASRLILSQQRVFNLGFFENVEPTFERANDEGDLDLVWNVEEKFTGQFNMAIGYSALDRITGTIGIGHPNVLGNGWQANFNWEFGQFKRQFLISFTEPWLLDTPTSVGFDLFSLRRTRFDYDEDRRGVSVRLARPVPGLLHTRASTTWKVEDVDVDVSSSSSSLARYETDGPQTTISTLWTLVRNSRDNYQFPTSGSESTLSAEFAGGALGGDVSFHKYLAKSVWSVPTLWKLALHVGVEAGYVNGFSSPDQVPIYERFEMGGTFINPLRGYPDRSIGPRQDGLVLGGRTMLKTTLETSFPVAENQVYGLAFFDAGNTWEDLVSTHPFDLKRGAGVGVRLVVPPIGLIGFDFGYGFDRIDGGQWEPHFQFGNQGAF